MCITEFNNDLRSEYRWSKSNTQPDSFIALKVLLGIIIRLQQKIFKTCRNCTAKVLN